jgi:hypothetical protein
MSRLFTPDGSPPVPGVHAEIFGSNLKGNIFIKSKASASCIKHAHFYSVPVPGMLVFCEKVINQASY